MKKNGNVKEAKKLNTKRNIKEVKNMKTKVNVNEAKNMKTKTISMKEAGEAYFNLSREERKKIGDKADDWKIRIDYSKEDLKKFLKKSKTDAIYAIMNYLITNKMTKPDKITEKFTKKQNKTQGISVADFVKINAKGKNESIVQIFNKLQEEENQPMDKQREQGISVEKMEIQKVQNKKPSNDPKPETKKQHQERMEFNRKVAELRRQAQNEKKQQSMIDTFEYVKHKIGITKEDGAKMHKEEGFPVLKVAYQGYNTTYKGKRLDLSYDDRMFMRYSPKMELPMIFKDCSADVIYAKPCKEEITRMIEQRKRQKQKEREEAEKNSILAKVIVFRNRVEVITENEDANNTVSRYFREKVLEDPEKMQGIWKMYENPKFKREGQSYYTELSQTPEKMFTNKEIEIERMKKFGVHNETFKVAVMNIEKGYPRYAPLSEKSHEDTAYDLLDVTRIRMSKDKLKKIVEKGEGQVWELTYGSLFKDVDKRTRKRYFWIDDVKHVGTHQSYRKEYVKKLREGEK